MSQKSGETICPWGRTVVRMGFCFFFADFQFVGRLAHCPRRNGKKEKCVFSLPSSWALSSPPWRWSGERYLGICLETMGKYMSASEFLSYIHIFICYFYSTQMITCSIMLCTLLFSPLKISLGYHSIALITDEENSVVWISQLHY